MKKNLNNLDIGLNWITHRVLGFLFFIGWCMTLRAQPTALLESTDRYNLAAPTFEKVPLHRIQIRITTANVKDAGTDDDIYIKLNDRDKAFYLDRARNDFERNKTATFDILPAFVKEVADIDFLTIGHKGTDAICLKKVELLLNDNKYPVYVKEFAGGKWLDNGQSTNIRGNEMRNFDGWKYTSRNRNIWHAPTTLSRSTITKLIEASIGNQIEYEGGLAWGDNSGPVKTLFGDAVELSYVNNTTVHVDLDLECKVKGPNFEVDVDFDIVFHCDNGRLAAEVKNMKVTTDKVGDIYKFVFDKAQGLVTNSIGGPLGGLVPEGSLSKFLGYKATFASSNPNVSGNCTSIKVTRGLDLIVVEN